MGIKKITRILGAYQTPVQETIDIDRPLIRPIITLALVQDVPYSTMLKNSGINVEVCTKVGTHTKDFNNFITEYHGKTF